MEELGKKIGLSFVYCWDDMSEFYEHAHPEHRLKGKDAADLIATSQKVFEDLVFNEIKAFHR